MYHFPEEAADDDLVSFPGSLKLGLAGLALTLLFSVQVKISAQQSNAPVAGSSRCPSSQRQFLDRYCVSCHNEKLKTGGLSLVQVDLSKPGTQSELWGRCCASCTPASCRLLKMPQPPEADRLAMVTWLQTSLDAGIRYRKTETGAAPKHCAT